MRAIVLKNGTLKFGDGFDIPKADKGESLIRVKMSTICNLDKLLINGYSNFNGILGHEFVGVVEESAAKPELIGKRVVADMRLNCGVCEYCRGKRPEMCLHRREIGFLDKDGCFAEYMVVPNKNIHILPDNVPDEHAIFVEPLAVCLGLTKKCKLRKDSRVALVGDLRALYFTAMILNKTGVNVHVIGKNRERLEFLSKFATVSVAIDGKFDNVIEQSGEFEGFLTALKLVNYGGRIVVNSIYTGQHIAANLSMITVKEISIVGSRTGLYEEAIKFMAEGLFERPEIELFGLEQCKEAFEADCICPVFVL